METEQKITRIKVWLDKWGYSEERKLPDSYAANVRSEGFDPESLEYLDIPSLADLVYALFE